MVEPSRAGSPRSHIRPAPSAARRIALAAPRVSALSLAALAFAFMTFLGGFVSGMALLSWIPGGATAWLLGRRALRDIRNSDGRLSGRGIARAAIVLGVLQCVGSLLLMLTLWLCLRQLASGITGSERQSR